MEKVCRSQRWICFHSPPMWPARTSTTASRCPWATAAGRTHTAPLSFSTSSHIKVPFIARCLLHTLISNPFPLFLHSTPPLQRYDNTSHAIHTDNTFLRGAVSIGLYNNILESSLWHCLSLGNHLFWSTSFRLVESLCSAQKTKCDSQYSECNDTSGIPYCQCHPGYFKKNPGDMTCRGTTYSCPFSVVWIIKLWDFVECLILHVSFL